MGNSLPFHLYLGFYLRYFPENTYFALFAHALQALQLYIFMPKHGVQLLLFYEL